VKQDNPLTGHWEIEYSCDTIFAFCSDFEQFPSYMLYIGLSTLCGPCSISRSTILIILALISFGISLSQFSNLSSTITVQFTIYINNIVNYCQARCFWLLGNDGIRIISFFQPIIVSHVYATIVRLSGYTPHRFTDADLRGMLDEVGCRHDIQRTRKSYIEGLPQGKRSTSCMNTTRRIVA
jgi:hypothetical protein